MYPDVSELQKIAVTLKFVLVMQNITPTPLKNHIFQKSKLIVLCFSKNWLIFYSIEITEKLTWVDSGGWDGVVGF